MRYWLRKNRAKIKRLQELIKSIENTLYEQTTKLAQQLFESSNRYQAIIKKYGEKLRDSKENEMKAIFGSISTAARKVKVNDELTNRNLKKLALKRKRNKSILVPSVLPTSYHPPLESFKSSLPYGRKKRKKRTKSHT